MISLDSELLRTAIRYMIWFNIYRGGKQHGKVKRTMRLNYGKYSKAIYLSLIMPGVPFVVLICVYIFQIAMCT